MDPLGEATTQELVDELASRSEAFVAAWLPTASPEREVHWTIKGCGLDVMGLGRFMHYKTSPKRQVTPKPPTED